MTHHGEGACIQIADYIAAMAALKEERKARERAEAELETAQLAVDRMTRNWLVSKEKSGTN